MITIKDALLVLGFALCCYIWINTGTYAYTRFKQQPFTSTSMFIAIAVAIYFMLKAIIMMLQLW